MNVPVTLGEYSEESIPQIKEKDVEYLNAHFLRKSAIKVHYNQKGEVKLENSSYAGIIQLKDVRIHFSTKVKANLFYMLSFLKSEKSFICDPLKSIEIEDGGSFFDILGKLFYNELNDIVKQGLLKKYIKREENIKYLKGKLLFNQQISQNLLFKPNFYCRYNDLTCDNMENQIILRATNLIIPMIRYNDKLRYSLLQLERDLKQEVSFNTCLSPKDCDLICYDRLNEHYHSIIEFSKLIFEEHFIRSIHKGPSKGFNFIVNMPKVYEDFLTEMIVEVVEEEPEFLEYSVASQLKFNTLIKKKNITTKPDIILKKGKDQFPLILDAKYKKSDSNSDFYQMIAYSLAIPSSKKCCLIYPEYNRLRDENYTVFKDLEKENSDTINLCIKTISLFEKENEDFNSFIGRTKEQIKQMLTDLLDIA